LAVCNWSILKQPEQKAFTSDMAFTLDHIL